MDRERIGWPCLGVVSAVLWTAFLLPSVRAAADKADPLRLQAEAYERNGQWERACEAWDDLLHKDRNLLEIKERYLACLRHLHQARRLHDAGFRQQILSQRVTFALKIYDEVLGKVQANYVNRNRADLTQLFQQGLDELRLALSDDAFVAEYLSGVKKEAVHGFRSQLAETWQGRVIRSRREALAEVREVALAAQRSLGLKPTVTVLEFACGACNGLDEYTFYLTPSQLNDLYASLKGEIVGIGIEVSLEDQKLVIAQVALGSPAALANPPLKPGDRILRIDKKPVDKQPPETVMERLKGGAGSSVELEVLSIGERGPHVLFLTRQPVAVPSVLAEDILAPDLGVGYFQLIGFQETTVQEMDDAIRRLKGRGMRVLIMDLRGNPGGLFPVAIQIAERFLSEGVITSTDGQVSAYNKKYEANNVAALAIPLVVLVDGDTASAAEVVAGAFKDNHRATLVGQTTYGKGTMQCVLKLDTVPAGIRITVAKFFSPRGQAYAGLGVVPHILVERTSLSFDEQLQAALHEARQLAMSR